jgi:hypothetical protein
MAAEALACALERRFDTIRRGELVRLRKKVNGLTPEGREAVEVATRAIVAALTARCAALGEVEPQMLVVVSELFGAIDGPASPGESDERKAFLLSAFVTNP